MPCKFNLIPFNPFPGSGVPHAARASACSRSSEILHGRRTSSTTIRKTRGDDIDAACGQLAGHVQDRSKRRLTRLQPVAVPAAVGTAAAAADLEARRHP